MMFKTCTRCNSPKELLHFAQRKASKDGFNSACKECVIAYRQSSKYNISEYNKKYREKHRDVLIERSKDWRDVNAEKVVLYKRHYRKAEPLKHSVWDANKRAKRLQRFPPWLTEEDRQSISKVYEEAKTLSRITGISYQVDHIVPLLGDNVSGLHVPWNLQVLTGLENNIKNNKFYEDEI